MAVINPSERKLAKRTSVHRVEKFMVGKSGVEKSSSYKGPSISNVSSEGEEGGTPKKPMKGDENKHLDDVVYDLPKILKSR